VDIYELRQIVADLAAAAAKRAQDARDDGRLTEAVLDDREALAYLVVIALIDHQGGPAL